MAVLGRQDPIDDPEFELVLLQAREAGARTASRRRLAGLIPVTLLLGTFTLSCLAVALGVP
ncbi:MAG: hypothetical protein HOQ07_13350 [Sinomonas sp.]|nr:hypothetical protein [Sinomonas sp.]